MDIKRIKQVMRYGWMHAGQIANTESKGTSYRLRIFCDIVYCYNKYKMWSNQYLTEQFYQKNAYERNIIGRKYYEEGIKRDSWQNDFRENKKFLLKYSQLKYELASKRDARNEAYAKRYNAGNGLFVEHDVELSRQHYLEGQITMGNNVLLAKNVFIDYSGIVTIGNHVSISDGVYILTHGHENHQAFQSTLVVESNCWIGARACILETCHKIGRGSIIGVGAVVRNSIPPYAIVIGNPAKIVGFTLSPEEVIERELKLYPEEDRLPLDLLEKNYNKYFLKNIKEIRSYTRLLI